jgi:hypothetical protein
MSWMPAATSCDALPWVVQPAERLQQAGYKVTMGSTSRDKGSVALASASALVMGCHVLLMVKPLAFRVLRSVSNSSCCSCIGT